MDVLFTMLVLVQLDNRQAYSDAVRRAWTREKVCAVDGSHRERYKLVKRGMNYSDVTKIFRCSRMDIAVFGGASTVIWYPEDRVRVTFDSDGLVIDCSCTCGR